MPYQRKNKKVNKIYNKTNHKVQNKKINKKRDKKKYKNINLELIQKFNRFERRKYLMTKIKCKCTDCDGDNSIMPCKIETYLDNNKIKNTNYKVTQV